MKWYTATLTINSNGRGLHDFTDQINAQLRKWEVEEGMVYLFIQHTSASLVINENYDSSARRDMETFLERIAPEGESWIEHNMEGTDDAPSHLRTMITPTNVTIPVDNGKLNLGTWQGVFLAEHRQHGRRRQILLRVLSVE